MMSKEEVKKMIIETFDEDYSNTIKAFKNLKNKENGNRIMYDRYFKITEKMYGYIVGIIDLYFTMTDTLRCLVSEEFYPIYKTYREKLWNECEKYMEINK